MQIEPLTRLEWLAQTKFWLPELALDTIERTELEQNLQKAVLTHRITLLSAPAGSGKTTLLTTLPKLLPEYRLTWLALDETDNDLIQFVTALIGSLRQLCPDFGENILELLTEAEKLAAQTGLLVGALINEINQKLAQPFGVIVDDLHWITEPAICKLLNYLVERLPPQMRLIIASRYEPSLPLASWRARGQLAELRLEQLRFTATQIVTFFRARLGVELTEQETATLLAQTDGWAAALRLIASRLAFSKLQTTQPLLNQVEHSERYIFDYLAEEILSRLPTAEYNFLLQTSLLTELTPALCESLSGLPNSAQMLDNFYRRNLFLTLLDSRNSTYRYHDLFKEFLQHKLKQEKPLEIAQLHKKAAQAQATNPGQAMRHWLAGQWWDEAAQLLEQISDSMFKLGRLGALHSWLQALPAEYLVAHPKLGYYQSRYAITQGQWSVARKGLEECLLKFEAANQQTEQAECLVALIFCCFNQHALEQAEQYLQQALKLPLSPQTRVKLLLGQASQYAQRRQWQERVQLIKEIFQLALELNLPEVHLEVLMQIHLPDVNLPGLLVPLKNFCLSVLPKTEDAFLQTSALTLLSYGYLLEGNLEKSIRTFEQAQTARKAAEVGGLLELDMLALDGLHKKWLGDTAGLQVLGESFFWQMVQQEVAQPWLNAFLSHQVLDAIYENRIAEANDLFKQLEYFKFPYERPENEVCKLTLSGLLATDYLTGEDFMRQAQALQKILPFSLAWGDMQLFLAYFYYRWKKPAQAIAELNWLLDRLKTEGIPGLILKNGAGIVEPLLKLAIEQGVQADYARQLLQLLRNEATSIPPAQPLKLPNSPETLSARELEVLQMLATRATNREIAEQLVISETTVKTHVQHILQKLGLTSRNQVTNYMRENGLL